MTTDNPRPPHILIVEDSLIQAELLRRVLTQHDYRVTIAHDGAEGLHLAQAEPPDLIITDISMPVMNGFELCRNIRLDPLLHNIPVILLTSMSDIRDIIHGLNAGADNYVTKPYDSTLLVDRINDALKRKNLSPDEAKLHLTVEVANETFQVHAGSQQILNLLLSTYRNAMEQNKLLQLTQDQLTRLNNQLQEEVEKKTAALIEHEHNLSAEREKHLEDEANHYRELRDTLMDSVTAIAATVEMRDPYTSGHQRRVAMLALAIGRFLQLPQSSLEALQISGVVHDVGKIHIPAEILVKPGKLDKIEFAIIQTHPQVGYEILNSIHFPWPIAEIVVQHHERQDGSGYPHGLSGDRILVEAKILAVADVVEAMSTHRPYRPALGMEVALEEITNAAGIKYDADVVDACVKVVLQGLWEPETR